MSNKYNDIMNRITVDEDMKKRILLNIENISKENQNVKKDEEFKVKFTPHRFKKNIVVLAASLMLIICSIAIQPFRNLFNVEDVDSQVLESTPTVNSNESNKDAVVKDSTVAPTENVKEIDKQINTTTSKQEDTPINKVDEDKKTQNSYSQSKEKQVQETNPKVQANNPQIQEATSKIQDSTSKVQDSYSKSNIKNNNDISNFNETASNSVVARSPMSTRTTKQEFNNINDLKNSVDFQFKVPQILPENFSLTSMSVVSQKLISLNYSNNKNIIEFMVTNGNSDININSNVSKYESEKNIKLDGQNVTLKGTNKLINVAAWVEDNVSYLILSSNGLDEKDVLNMVKSIKIP